MLVHIWTTQFCIPEDSNSHNYCCENIKFSINAVLFMYALNVVWFIHFCGMVYIHLCILHMFKFEWKQKSWTSDILRILTLEFWRHLLLSRVLNNRQKRNRHKLRLRLLDKLAGDEKELNTDAMNFSLMFWSMSIFLCPPKVRHFKGCNIFLL
jgi:hypothetical protein